MKFGEYITMSDQLMGEYKEAFEYIESYSDVHMVRGSYKNEKMMDLLDVLLTAQNEKMDVSKIVGGDLDSFAKEFFSDITIIDYLEPLFSSLKFWAYLILIFEGMIIIQEHSAQIDISSYLSGILLIGLGTVVVDLISIVLIKRKCYTRKKYVVLQIVVTLIVLISLFYFIWMDIKIMLPAVPVLLSVVAYLLIYYLCKFLYRYKKTGTIRKSKNEYDTTFTRMVKDEVGTIDYSMNPLLLKTFSDKFTKINRKRAKKGLQPLTTKEFLDKRELLSHFSVFGGFLFGFALAGIYSLFSIGFENSLDRSVFAVIVLGSCLLLYFVFVRPVNRIVRKQNEKILKHCNEEGVEIDQLYKKKEDKFDENK